MEDEIESFGNIEVINDILLFDWLSQSYAWYLITYEPTLYNLALFAGMHLGACLALFVVIFVAKFVWKFITVIGFLLLGLYMFVSYWDKITYWF